MTIRISPALMVAGVALAIALSGTAAAATDGQFILKGGSAPGTAAVSGNQLLTTESAPSQWIHTSQPAGAETCNFLYKVPAHKELVVKDVIFDVETEQGTVGGISVFTGASCEHDTGLRGLTSQSFASVPLNLAGQVNFGPGTTITTKGTFSNGSVFLDGYLIPTQ